MPIRAAPLSPGLIIPPSNAINVRARCRDLISSVIIDGSQGGSNRRTARDPILREPEAGQRGVVAVMVMCAAPSSMVMS